LTGQRRQNRVAYSFLAPFLIIFLTFILFPVFYSLYLSLHRVTDLYDVFGGMRFVGLHNFMTLFRDREFWWALLVTFYYGILSVPLGIAASLGLALLMNRKLPFRSFLRSAFFLPYVLDVLVVAIVWTFIFSAPYGILNRILETAGIHFFSRTGFLGHPALAIPSIVLSMTLKNIGFGMILFLTALQNISPSVYEAASIDGTTPWQRLRYITLPLLKPMTLFMIIIGTIGVLNAFAEIYGMTGGGPNVTVGNNTFGATKVTGFLLYQKFASFKLGYAAAISYILLIITLVISFFNTKLLRVEQV
jgi:ABC-type sugar transport system permease subunit